MFMNHGYYDFKITNITYRQSMFRSHIIVCQVKLECPEGVIFNSFKKELLDTLYGNSTIGDTIRLKVIYIEFRENYKFFSINHEAQLRKRNDNEKPNTNHLNTNRRDHLINWLR